MTRRRQQRIIIIGAGIGGLAAALRLADTGADVVVFERQDGPGGKMLAQPSAGGPLDTGPTVLTLRNVFDALFASVGLRLPDHLDLIPQAVLARHWWHDGSTLDLYADHASSRDAIQALSGSRDAVAFDRFGARARRLFEAFDAPMMRAPVPDKARITAHVAAHPGIALDMRPWQSFATLLRNSFSDPRLRQLFGRYATYTGGAPALSPALTSLIWHTEAEGVWKVRGGMNRLAETLAELATERGARFHYGTHVETIETSGKEVTAIRVNGKVESADAILFNGDPRALHLGLLGQSAQTAVPDAAVTPRSHSAHVWSFAARPSDMDLVHHNVFFADPPGTEFDDLHAGRTLRDPSLYVCAQDRGDPETSPGNPERFEIIANAPPMADGDTPQTRAEEARTCHRLTFRSLARFGLTFSPAPDQTTQRSPATFESLYPGSAGSLYGRSPHGLMAAFQRPTARTPFPGLYLAGGGTHPGAGVPMAALSARHAAEAIMADLALTSTSRPTAMPGGTSTVSRTAVGALSRSSLS